MSFISFMDIRYRKEQIAMLEREIESRKKNLCESKKIYLEQKEHPDFVFNTITSFIRNYYRNNGHSLLQMDRIYPNFLKDLNELVILISEHRFNFSEEIMTEIGEYCKRELYLPRRKFAISFIKKYILPELEKYEKKANCEFVIGICM